jgi:hypothetical protein
VVFVLVIEHPYDNDNDNDNDDGQRHRSLFFCSRCGGLGDPFMSDSYYYPMMYGSGRPTAPGEAAGQVYPQQPMGYHQGQAAYPATPGAMAPGGAMPYGPAGMAAMGPSSGGYAVGPMHGGVYPMAPGMPGAYPPASSGGLFGISNDRFFRGLLIGAAATYILTNESVQRSAIKGVVKVWSMVQGGIEEAKERFQDAEAEIAAGEAAKRD